MSFSDEVHLPSFIRRGHAYVVYLISRLYFRVQEPILLDSDLQLNFNSRGDCCSPLHFIVNAFRRDVNIAKIATVFSEEGE